VLQKLERDLVARKSLKKKSSKAIEVEHITLIVVAWCLPSHPLNLRNEARDNLGSS